MRNHRKWKVAWGITGSGDQLAETLEIMERLDDIYENDVEIEVYLSKAARVVLKYYDLEDRLKTDFPRVLDEIDSNSPFLAGWLQKRRYEFLLIAPATSNSVAKISIGIADTLICNAAIMALKALVPVYMLPSDYAEGTLRTKLPDGKETKLKIRKEDAANVRKLSRMENVFLLRRAEEIPGVFEERFGSRRS